MRRILWASAIVALGGLSANARAEEPRPGLLERGREVIQACCHKNSPKRGSCGSACNPCSQDDVKIGMLIDTLLCGERIGDRRRAADALDKYNWTQHPEIVAALTYAMQSDPEPRVRWNAADALKDMKVSEPDAIGAMHFSQSADPSCRTRYKAKWGAILGERNQPSCVTYVSGYGLAKSENGQKSTPKLERAPEQRDMDTEEPAIERGTGIKPTSRTSVRSFLSTAVEKVRSRS